MGSALDALGDALGVEPDSRASPGRWFLRLFFRSPRELRPLPHAVTELGRLLHRRSWLSRRPCLKTSGTSDTSCVVACDRR